LNGSRFFEGKILDGRNRYRALKTCGTALEADHFERFEKGPEEAALFVLSKNLRRRHLTVGQRAAIANNLYEKIKQLQGLRHGGDHKSAEFQIKIGNPDLDQSKAKEVKKKVAAAVASVDSMELFGHWRKSRPRKPPR
jgi:hypothetical protein